MDMWNYPTDMKEPHLPSHFLFDLVFIYPAEEPQETECWQESDNEIEDDTQDCVQSEPNAPDIQMDSRHQGLDSEQAAVVWWVVVFTCTLQSLHSLSLRTIEWLLKFLVLLTFLRRYSGKISEIARAVPSTLFLRTKYIREKVSIPPIFRKVACRYCHSLYKYEDCIEREEPERLSSIVLSVEHAVE